MDLERVKYKNNRPYIEQVIKSGKHKGYANRVFGKIERCKKCQKEAFMLPEGQFCSISCQNSFTKFKTGRTLHKAGYVYIRIPNHPFANRSGYIFEHRVVVEKQIGRYLYRYEVVHHVNKIKDDNRIDNLILFKDNYAHKKFEAIEEGLQQGDIVYNGKSST